MNDIAIDEAIRRRIKESTGFDYEEVILGGLKSGPYGHNTELTDTKSDKSIEQSTTAPLPLFVSESERLIYSQLFQDIIRDIDNIKSEIFRVERALMEFGSVTPNNSNSSSSNSNSANVATERTRRKKLLESKHVSLILQLSQAEEAYRSLMDKLEKGRTQSLADSASEQSEKMSTTLDVESSPVHQSTPDAHTVRSTVLEEFKKVVEEQKASFLAEQEKAKVLVDELRREDDMWRLRREQHRNDMVEFTVACQSRINELNREIETYQRQLIEAEQRMLNERNHLIRDVRRKTKETLEVCVFIS